MKAKQAAAKYFRSMGLDVKEDAVLRGRWGLEYKFDLIVRDGGGIVRGVWVKDWRRVVGINVVIRLDRISEEVGLGRPILIAGRFSPSVHMYAFKRGIELITIGELMRAVEKTLVLPQRP